MFRRFRERVRRSTGRHEDGRITKPASTKRKLIARDERPARPSSIRKASFTKILSEIAATGNGTNVWTGGDDLSLSLASMDLGSPSLSMGDGAVEEHGAEDARSDVFYDAHDSFVESEFPQPTTTSRDPNEATAGLFTGILNLQDSEDTAVHTHYAPAITHETVIPTFHEIQEFQITREINQHHIYHRVLPVIDVEVLPPRHFLRSNVDGRIEELQPQLIPSYSAKDHAMLESRFKALLFEEMSAKNPSGCFASQDLQGCDFRTAELWSSDEMQLRTEDVWLYPPSLSNAAQFHGETEAFHFGSADPRDNGLR